MGRPSSVPTCCLPTAIYYICQQVGCQHFWKSLGKSFNERGRGAWTGRGQHRAHMGCQPSLTDLTNPTLHISVWRGILVTERRKTGYGLRKETGPFCYPASSPDSLPLRPSCRRHDIPADSADEAKK